MFFSHANELPWDSSLLLACLWNMFFVSRGEDVQGHPGTEAFVTSCLLHVHFEQLSFSASSRIGLLVILSLQTFDCYLRGNPWVFFVLLFISFPAMSFFFHPIIYPRWKLFNDCDVQSPHLTVAYSPAFQTILLDFYLHEPAVLTAEQFRAIPYKRPLP